MTPHIPHSPEVQKNKVFHIIEQGASEYSAHHAAATHRVHRLRAGYYSLRGIIRRDTAHSAAVYTACSASVLLSTVGVETSRHHHIRREKVGIQFKAHVARSVPAFFIWHRQPGLFQNGFKTYNQPQHSSSSSCCRCCCSSGGRGDRRRSQCLATGPVVRDSEKLRV